MMNTENTGGTEGGAEVFSDLSPLVRAGVGVVPAAAAVFLFAQAWTNYMHIFQGYKVSTIVTDSGVIETTEAVTTPEVAGLIMAGLLLIMLVSASLNALPNTLYVKVFNSVLYCITALFAIQYAFVAQNGVEVMAPVLVFIAVYAVDRVREIWE